MEWGIRQIEQLASQRQSVSPGEEAHKEMVLADISRFLSRRYVDVSTTDPVPTPRMPLGH